VRSEVRRSDLADGTMTGMTTPEPNVPVDRSLPEPENLATALEAPEEAGDMAVENDPRGGTGDQEEQ
jgi:hypothetical protein